MYGQRDHTLEEVKDITPGMDLDRQKETNKDHGEPSLAEMVKKAIGILNKSNNGYFLLVALIIVFGG